MGWLIVYLVIGFLIWFLALDVPDTDNLGVCLVVTFLWPVLLVMAAFISDE
jgi:hypothetical protein